MFVRRMAAGIAAVLIGGVSPAAHARDWPQWCGRDCRNLVSDAKALPTQFDVGEVRKGKTPRAASKNVLWTARLGSQTYGGPVVAGGRIFVGTNNDKPRDPKYSGNRGVLMCFREADGQLLWQLVVPKLKSGGNFNGDYGKLGICATPAVDGDRVYVMTNRCAVVCLDVHGLANGNDGPFKDEARSYAQPRSEKYKEGPDGPIIQRVPGDPVELGETDADILWRFDMMKEISCWPQDASACSVLVHGDYVCFGTSNGVDRSHRRLPYPNAPSFVMLDKKTGRLVAVDKSNIGPNIYHGQWSSPSLGVVNGRELIFYGAGDGFCYAFDARPVGAGDGKVGTIREVWRFDCNPPEYRVDENGKKIRYQTKHGAKGVLSPCECIGTAAFHDNRLYVSIGQDTLHGTAPGCLSCIDATKTGDISRTGKVWMNTEVERSLSTAAVTAGLVYWADYTGRLFCIDADTGKIVWTHDVRDRIWSSPLVGDGKVYIGTKRGYLHVLAAGREKKEIARIKLDTGVFATPVVANGAFYVATMTRLYAVRCGAPAG
jgi:outer membrane protein assembly factor BamB